MRQLETTWRVTKASKGPAFPGDVIFSRVFLSCSETRAVFAAQRERFYVWTFIMDTY